MKAKITRKRKSKGKGKRRRRQKWSKKSQTKTQCLTSFQFITKNLKHRCNSSRQKNNLSHSSLNHWSWRLRRQQSICRSRLVVPAITFLPLNTFPSFTLSWEGHQSVSSYATKCWRGLRTAVNHKSSPLFWTITKQQHWISWGDTLSRSFFWRSAWDIERKTTSTKTLVTPTSQFRLTRRPSTTTRRP